MSNIKNNRDRILAGASNFILRPFAWLWALMPMRANSSGKVKKILVMRLDNIGDVLMTTPIFREYKNKISTDVEMDFLVLPVAIPLIDGDPYIDRYIPFTAPWFKRPKRLSDVVDFLKLSRRLWMNDYDMVIDSRGDIRNILFMLLLRIPLRVGFARTGGEYMLSHCAEYDKNIHFLDNNVALLQSISQKRYDQYYSLVETEKGKQEAIDILADLNLTHEKKYVILFPCSHFSSKEWPVERFAQLADILVNEHDYCVLLSGSPGERDRCESVKNIAHEHLDNIAGKLSLKGLASLIAGAVCTVGNDSAPAHISAALDRCSLVIFGPMDYRMCGPMAKTVERVKVLYHQLPCSFCNSVKILPVRCRDRKTPECLDLLSVECVREEFSTLIEENCSQMGNSAGVNCA